MTEQYQSDAQRRKAERQQASQDSRPIEPRNRPVEKSDDGLRVDYDQAKRTGRTFDDFDTWKTKETEAAKARPAQEPVKELTREERIDRVIANFQHGLNHNNPRTQAELNELKEVLGIKPADDKLSKAQIARFTGTVVQREPNDALRAENVQYDLVPGVIVPPTQRLADVPVSLSDTHQQWRGHQYYLVNDQDDDPDNDRIVIVDRDRKIVAIVGTDGNAVVDKDRDLRRPGVDGTTTRAVNHPDEPTYRQPL